MPIHQQTLATLEYPKILERLARSTSFSVSRELALALEPSTDLFVVRERLRRTGEARRLFEDFPDVTIGGARDVRPAAHRARRGGALEAPAFLEIAATLASGRLLRATLTRLDEERFPLLRRLAEDLPNLPGLETAITQTVGEDGEVLDSASPKLGQLRASIRVAFNRLQERLQSVLSSSQYAEALQEPIITVREGRYVVPVKASHRRVVRGLVHDQSSSGATLYVEPMAVVELNNQWRELQSAEREEVARILAALSDQVGAQAEQIVTGVEAIGQLDLTFAMAKYADLLKCVEPEMVELATGVAEATGPGDPDAAPVRLRKARHPLLDQQRVVPTDMWLGGDFRLLLITGPNTGGKTVALKTTGLLALMAQTGLHIPAEAPSRLPIFSQIFADIGDEQSIEQSLSTFSSHMSHIIQILRALEEPIAQERLLSGETIDWSEVEDGAALVLLDELGAGTDPVEGAALARAIIERLLSLGVLGVATTHYAELKAFAYATEGVENSSVEFDVETLAPTYRLTIGLPGRSNALAIATRLGLDGSLVERARSMMAREDAQVEDLLAGIHREREAAAAELARAEVLRDDAEKYRDRLSTELSDFELRREAEWQAARDEIESELREARAQLRRLRDDFRSVSLTRQWLEEAEQRVQEIREKTPSEPPKARTKPPAPPAAPAQQAPRPLQVGDRVMVRSVGLMGEIISIDEDDQTAEVQVGGFRVEASLAELRREKDARKEEAPPRPQPQRSTSLPPPPEVSMDFDIRGWRVGEVVDRLDRYLNDAYLAGLPSVRIIHGKGTGALRQVVREVLGSHPLVASFGGGGQDGGEGVTVVKMSNR
ncbi:MAG TPA: endonuclease MutS2 [Roseiflexaceae bacterium]|nr:endonuclease MutS2 [Roseiflexaceae bacterium]